MSAAGIPVISATRSGGNFASPFLEFVEAQRVLFDVIFVDKSSAMITFIMPRASAPSVPGLMTDVPVGLLGSTRATGQ